MFRWILFLFAPCQITGNLFGPRALIGMNNAYYFSCFVVFCCLFSGLFKMSYPEFESNPHLVVSSWFAFNYKGKCSPNVFGAGLFVPCIQNKKNDSSWKWVQFFYYRDTRGGKKNLPYIYPIFKELCSGLWTPLFICPLRMFINTKVFTTSNIRINYNYCK